MFALIDGDVLLYRIGYACQKNVYRIYDGDEYLFSSRNKKRLNEWLEMNKLTEDDFEIRKEIEVDSFENCKMTFYKQIETIREDTNAVDYLIILSGQTNFREEAAISFVYKGNRTREKPVLYCHLKKYIIDKYPHFITEDEEADDMLGKLHTLYTHQGIDSIICTIDKDLDMIPGKHYNFVKRIMYDISPEDAIKNFYKQLLEGDYIDNIKGISGVGKITANKLIDKCKTEEEMYKLCLDKYKEEFGDNGESRLLENAKLLWIRQYEKEEWQPPISG